MRAATYQDLQEFMDRFHDASLAKAAKKHGARFEHRVTQLGQEKRAAQRATLGRYIRQCAPGRLTLALLKLRPTVPSLVDQGMPLKIEHVTQGPAAGRIFYLPLLKQFSITVQILRFPRETSHKKGA